MKSRVLATVFMVMLAVPVYADSIDEAEAKRRGITVAQVQAENKLAAVQKENDALTAKVAALQKQLDELGKKVDVLNFEVDKSHSDLAGTKSQADDDRKRDAQIISGLQKQLAAANAQLAKAPKPSYTLAKGMTLEQAKAEIPGYYDAMTNTPDGTTYRITWLVLAPATRPGPSGVPVPIVPAAMVNTPVVIGLVRLVGGKVADWEIDADAIDRNKANSDKGN